MFTRAYERTPEHREKMAAIFRGRKHTPEHTAKSAAGLKGRIMPLEERKRQQEALKFHRNLKTVECNCYVHSHKSKVSSLTWLLAEALDAIGFTVQPEASLSRRSVDVLLVDEWIAFEADGAYWHEVNEIRLPGYHEKRENELLRDWSLPTIRLTENEVRALHSAVIK